MASTSRVRAIENPIPYWNEAARAAQDYINVKREHLMLTAEIRAKHEAKRAILGGAGLIFGVLALTLFFFWMSNEIREAGMTSWGVALLCLFVLGGIGAAFAITAKRMDA